MSTDHRSNARAHVEALVELLRAASRPELDGLIEECESLSRAVSAFHIEGIRFRMFNVDRLLTRGGLPVPNGVAPIFADIRSELEAAGFHTRSHSAPGPGAGSTSVSM